MANSKLTKEQYYFTVNWALAARKDLSPTKKLIISIVNSFESSGKQCFVSDRKLAELLGLKAPRSVQAALKELERDGFLKRHSVDGRRFLTTGNVFPEAAEKKLLPPGNSVPQGIEAEFRQLYQNNEKK